MSFVKIICKEVNNLEKRYIIKRNGKILGFSPKYDLLTMIEDFSEESIRETYLSIYIDEYGRDAIDQGIVDSVDDPNFWEKVGE